MDNIAEILEEKNSDSKQKKRDIELSTPADFTPPEELYKDLIDKIRTYHPSTDISMIEKAYKAFSIIEISVEG